MLLLMFDADDYSPGVASSILMQSSIRVFDAVCKSLSTQAASVQPKVHELFSFRELGTMHGGLNVILAEIFTMLTPPVLRNILSSNA